MGMDKTNYKKNKSFYSTGYALMVYGMCLYVASDAIMKHYLSIYAIHQVTFLRTLCRFVPLLFAISVLNINPINTSRKKEHIVRAIIASSVTYCFMAALKYASMTDVTVIGYTTAIFMLPLGGILLKEKLYLRNVFMVLVGFMGILLIFRPGDVFFKSGATIAVIGAFLAALNQIMIKKLSTTDNEFIIIFYHHVVLLTFSGIASYCDFEPIQLNHFLVLMVGGVVGAFAQYLIIKALFLSETIKLATAYYIPLIPIVAIDYFVWNKVPDLYIMSGLILIVISSYHASKINH